MKSNASKPRLVALVGVVSLMGTVASGRVVSPPALVPVPVEVETRPGSFVLDVGTAVLVEAGRGDVADVGEYLADLLRRGTGHPVPRGEASASGSAENAILLTTQGGPAGLGDDAYRLEVAGDGVVLRSPTARGLFLGVQTIRQLLPPRLEAGARDTSVAWRMPCVRITDYPRYPWRGMLLDCCRHFMTKAFVKRYIDLLAYHKMNVLHWHLTEDQGWRIEIKKYPKLTQVGAWRGEGADKYGGYYTQDDVREIVEYARRRFVTIVPEIEMPGHCTAALASYPELSCTGGPFEVAAQWGVYSDVYCAGNDEVFAFLEDVLTEVMALFPSEFIHIGGDECPKSRWEACPKCQARIRSEALAGVDELQSYFVRRIEKFLNANHRRLVGWDEILEGGLAPNATVQSWRGMGAALVAARAGHDVIASPTTHCYLDYPQVPNPESPQWMRLITLEQIYSFEPMPSELTPAEGRHVLGAEGNIWTERAPQERVDHQVFPRLCGLAEVTWSPRERRDWGDFARRMGVHYQRLDELGVTYFVPPPDSVTPERVFVGSTEVCLTTPMAGGVVRFTLDGSEPTAASPRYERPIRLTDTTTVKARTVTASGRLSDVAVFPYRRAAPRDPVHVDNVQPGLAYAYYEGRWSQLPDFATLTPVAAGVTRTFNLSQRKRDDHFAFRFEGYINVPADGVYTFYLTSDDGSRLWIGPELVVDSDGLHGPAVKAGQVVLRAGRHPIVLACFEASGAEALALEYAGPGMAKRPVPPAVLWHQADR